MKSILITYFIFIISVSFSQIQLKNESLIEPKAKIVYRHYVNKITISGVAFDSTIFIVTHSDTLRLKYGSFFYMPKGSNLDNDTLKLFFNGKLIAQDVFQIKNLGRPDVYFGSLRDTLVTKKYLLSNPGLILSYEPELAIVCESIEEFEAFIIKKNGKKIELFDKSINEWVGWSEEKQDKYYEKHGSFILGSNKFTKKQLNMLKAIKTGDKIWFKTVVFSCSSCISRRVDLDFILTII